MHDEINALLEDKATRLEERVYWAACLGLIASVTGGLFTWHAQFAPLDNGLTFICVGADPKVIPACAVDSGPWPAHHWLLTSIGAAIIILVIGRVLLVIHRIKSLST